LKNLTKYLTSYAESEVGLLVDFPCKYNFEYTVVIPAYKESPEFITRYIKSNLAHQNSLMVLVINQPENDKNLLPQQQLFDEALSQGKLVWQAEHLSLVFISGTTSALLVVDKYHQPIDEKLGVGLARKIGCDIAAALIAANRVKSPWIFSTDADASLPDNYFNAVNELDKATVAACFNFYHQSDNQTLHQANALYEQALRYYVSGLRYAQSPYSFFTIGSILVFKAHAYAAVRGFPKRSAGEDFYLLNKLAKQGTIGWLVNECIILDARMSDRVPFGTGPAVKQIIDLQQENKDYCYYHPEIFSLLRTTIQAFESLYLYRHQLPLWYDKLDDEIVVVLKGLSFNRFIDKQSNSSEQQFLKQLNVWFDAFKTLKFIHSARDAYYPDIPLSQAIELSNFIPK